MTEVDDMATAAHHAKSCERFAARLQARIERRTREVATCTMEWAKKPAAILDNELYQMRALYLSFDRVKGRFNAEVKCDARCTGARGHNCECQCGGKNHGAGNASAAGLAAAQ